ncbi:hypothetical protein HNY73_021268 [Argiope bruennichi]|uniref:Uncharacterized protein n=1 Tax=Argiope bruennichi TaxID=94029 RepID=A0A8T0E9C9_ARGBR|nr:hypothetical protein HNY73_021268 [Argiope bruennichi]
MMDYKKNNLKVIVDAQLGGFNIRPGFGSPLIPTFDDIQMCRDNAKGRKYQLTFKLPTETCKPYCKYENETEQMTAVDGQFCCDFVGIGPTGLCKGGVCMVGGVVGWNRQRGLETLMD